MRLAASLAFAAAALLGTAAQAEDITVKLGVLNDMSSLYADIGGRGAGAPAPTAGEGVTPAPARPKGGKIKHGQPNQHAGGGHHDRQQIDGRPGGRNHHV